MHVPRSDCHARMFHLNILIVLRLEYFAQIAGMLLKRMRSTDLVHSCEKNVQDYFVTPRVNSSI